MNKNHNKRWKKTPKLRANLPDTGDSTARHGPLTDPEVWPPVLPRDKLCVQCKCVLELKHSYAKVKISNAILREFVI